MPSPKQPLLGSLAVQSPQVNPRIIHVTTETCHNLSLFKELMKEYRKLDDSVTMRLNRTVAQFRDRDRLGAEGNPQDEACAYFWKELVNNWQRRTDIIQYCVNAVGKTIEEKQESVGDRTKLDADQKYAFAATYSEEVKRNQIRNELTVETIVRQRSLDGTFSLPLIQTFKNRCRFFEPPITDVEARKWWDAAQRGR
ncbi:hypothetical protein BD410DRAFT_710329 [Rickenella mellea]|uniref:Caffeine-induced death protein 2 n=1 Tax=Rickenella mellea TaxID=50990 RepID=A0A4R5XFG8_9AGAM|nr:hypothetical protein BD410DRAFT_710329 [Rickenella mellea]